jgi:amino acid transporter
MQQFGPAPVQQEATPTGAIRYVRSLWWGSFLAGAVAVVLVVLSRDEQLDHLQDMVSQVDATVEASTSSSLAALVLWASVALLVAVMVVEATLVRLMMHRRRWARVTLLILLPVHLGVALVAEAFLAGPGTDGAMVGPFMPTADGALVRWLLALQLGLAVLAVAVSFLPRAGSWLRSR